MQFMICDRYEYHDIPTPDNNPYVDKYFTIMHKYGLTTGVWYPCELISTLPCPDMSDVWAFDIQLPNMPKYIRVLKSEIKDEYVKLDFVDNEADAIDHPPFPPIKAASSSCEAMFMEVD